MSSRASPRAPADWSSKRPACSADELTPQYPWCGRVIGVTPQKTLALQSGPACSADEIEAAGKPTQNAGFS